MRYASDTLLGMGALWFSLRISWASPRHVRRRVQAHPPSFTCAHHFPRTSIFLLFKSSKISSLQKVVVWEEASLFHKRLHDFLCQRQHFPEIPIVIKAMFWQFCN